MIPNMDKNLVLNFYLILGLFKIAATFPSSKRSSFRFLDNGAFSDCSLRFIRMHNNNNDDTDAYLSPLTNPSTIHTQDQDRHTLTTQISHLSARKFLTWHAILFIMPIATLPNKDLSPSSASFWKYGPTFVILVTYGNRINRISYIDDLELYKINFATKYIHADWHNEKWRLTMLSLTSSHHIDLPVELGSTTKTGLEHLWYTANKNMNQRYIKSRNNGWTTDGLFPGKNLPRDIGCGNYADVTKPWNFQRWNQCTLAELQIRLNSSVSTATREEAYGDFDSDFLGIGNLDLFEFPAYAILFNSYNYFIVEEIDSMLIFSNRLTE
ncbi:hypothetical protein Fcan01_18370 [Folsomia candida]|uniref:Uncharacterized protein n=1 Tax=Folsomia candida TaxID=158441 RepID=A0A226DRE1_FOLCA|nr:hypothetical protein Fcan01_18370 [Folsomia candida]